MALTRARPSAEFRVTKGWGIRVTRLAFVTLTGLLWRPIVHGREKVPRQGPVILAPVHRSFADFSFAFFTTRRNLFFMAKAELWENRFLGWFLSNVGVFPVQRDAADRNALQVAQRVLEAGQVLVLFPEGTRQSGPEVRATHEGAAFLAARTGAITVPIGIGGSDLSMPKGRKIPRPMRITVVVGDPMAPPARSESGRVPRSALREATEELGRRIEAAYAEARKPY